MKVLRRTGLPVAVWRRPDDSWRTWAYQAGQESDLRDLRAVTLTFQPLAQDQRNLFRVTNYWDTVNFVIDGLIGARVFTDRAHLATVILHAGKVAGVNGLELTIS